VLEALGVNLNIELNKLSTMLQGCGFIFMFAINHHPAMKHIMPIRKSIDHRTIFNLLGPLTNPASAKKYLLGVFDPSFIDRVADALLELNTTKAFIVSSHDGMDEISISTTTQFNKIDNNIVTKGIIDPRDYGFKLAPKDAILGGDSILNTVITDGILSGKLKDAKRDIVVINSAFALLVDGKARDIKEAKQMIEAQLDSGKAKSHLDKIVKISNQF